MNFLTIKHGKSSIGHIWNASQTDEDGNTIRQVVCLVDGDVVRDIAASKGKRSLVDIAMTIETIDFEHFGETTMVITDEDFERLWLRAN